MEVEVYNTELAIMLRAKRAGRPSTRVSSTLVLSNHILKKSLPPERSNPVPLSGHEGLKRGH